MIDPEELLHTLLDAGKPAGSTVAPETNLDSIESLPLVLFTVLGPGQDGNGPGLWDVTLDLSVIGATLDDARTTAKAFYDLVWSWNEDPAAATVDGVGTVSGVADASLFSRQPTSDVAVHGVTQYDGSFDLQLRN
jgi:hypothetical protein